MDESLIILDVETTGVDRSADEIVELAVQYGFGGPGHRAPQTVWRFKPSKPVGASSKIHRITDEMLASALPFRAYVQRIGEIIDQADILLGYNIQFDIDMLSAGFVRAGFPFPSLTGKCIVDGLRLWQQFEPRTLVAAHARFVGGDDFTDAHSAAADIDATARVILSMIGDFGLATKSWDEIAALADPDRLTWFGHTNHVRWIDGVPTIGFGKHKGKPVQDPEVGNYLAWVQKSDFPPHVKEIAHAARTLRGKFLAWALAKYPPPATDPAEGGP